jgi:hypothetical protein
MTDPRLEPGDDGPRLRGLRHLVGFPRLRDFVDALDRPGLGFDTLGDVERGLRALSPGERMEITVFCKVGPDWFTMPIAQHGHAAPLSTVPDSDPRGEEILAEIKTLQTLVRTMAHGRPVEPLDVASRELDAATPDVVASRGRRG